MSGSVDLVEIWRGDRVESRHRGHVVVARPGGAIVESWGDPSAVIYPRSSAKILQAIPLVESGAADKAGLSEARLALACASHSGAEIHTAPVAAWLADLGLGEDAMRCGAHMPSDKAAAKTLTCCDHEPGQVHNNCSGKHAGFLTLNQHLGAGPEYHEIDHPVQQAVRAVWEDFTGEPVSGWAIDGCSAPNFASSIAGLARAMARCAAATPDATDPRDRAASRLRMAMANHPELVAGEGRACTRLMRAMKGVSVKTGAEGVYVAMLPREELGIVVKIDDGATRAAETVIASLLVRYGVLDPESEIARDLIDAPMKNWRGMLVGYTRPVAGLAQAKSA